MKKINLVLDAMSVVMSSEFVQKGKSARNILIIIYNLFILSLIFLLSSCGMFKYGNSRNVQVKSLPYTDFYLANQTSKPYEDGYEEETNALNAKNVKVFRFLGSSDSLGNAVITLSTKDYKKSKKRIYAVKSGYEPEKFELHHQFNAIVLLDIIYPPAFLFDKYKILDEKEENELYLKEKARHDCFDFLQMANEEQDNEKRKKLLKSAIAQDYRNEDGVKSIALLELAKILMLEGDFHRSFLLLKAIRHSDPQFDISEQKELLQVYINSKNQKIMEKQEKWDRAFNTMNAIGSALTMAGQSIGGTSTKSGSMSTNSSSLSEFTDETSVNNGNYQTIYDTWARRAESCYNSITNTGIDYNKNGVHAGAAGTYSAGNYIQQKNAYTKAQQEMKKIRRKAEQKGIKIVISQWETAPIADPIQYNGVPDR